MSMKCWGGGVALVRSARSAFSLIVSKLEHQSALNLDRGMAGGALVHFAKAGGARDDFAKAGGRDGQREVAMGRGEWG